MSCPKTQVFLLETVEFVTWTTDQFIQDNPDNYKTSETSSKIIPIFHIKYDHSRNNPKCEIKRKLTW